MCGMAYADAGRMSEVKHATKQLYLAMLQNNKALDEQKEEFWHNYRSGITILMLQSQKFQVAHNYLLELAKEYSSKEDLQHLMPILQSLGTVMLNTGRLREAEAYSFATDLCLLGLNINALFSQFSFTPFPPPEWHQSGSKLCKLVLAYEQIERTGSKWIENVDKGLVVYLGSSEELLSNVRLDYDGQDQFYNSLLSVQLIGLTIKLSYQIAFVPHLIDKTIARQNRWVQSLVKNASIMHAPIADALGEHYWKLAVMLSDRALALRVQKASLDLYGQALGDINLDSVQKVGLFNKILQTLHGNADMFGATYKWLLNYISVIDNSTDIKINNHESLAEWLSKEGRLNLAFNNCLQAAKNPQYISPKASNIAHEYGKELLNREKYTEAIAAYSKAISWQPDNAIGRIISGVGMCHAMALNNEHRLAIQKLDHYIPLLVNHYGPTHSETQYALQLKHQCLTGTVTAPPSISLTAGPSGTINLTVRSAMPINLSIQSIVKSS